MKYIAFLPIVIFGLSSSNVLAHKNNAHNTQSATNASMSTDVLNNKNEKHPYAIQIILKDHQHIQQLLGRLDNSLNTTTDAGRANFKVLKDFLVKHETMEQTVWYPELERKNELKDVIKTLKKEEDEASAKLEKIEGIEDQDEFASQARKLIKEVKHHAKEEELRLFPKVKKAFCETELTNIGNKLMEYRQKNDIRY